MNRLPTSLLGSLMLILVPSLTQAFTDAVILDPGYVAGSEAWSLAGNPPEAGSTLMIVGKVQAFGAPFDDLDPGDPEAEFTYVVRDLTFDFVSYWDSGSGAYGGTFYFYAGGVLSIYRDPSRNASLVDPVTFGDGELILEAALSDFSIECSILPESACPPANLVSDFQFTGGALFDRVSRNGMGFLGTNHGSYTDAQDPVYFARTWTRVDVSVPEPVLPMTWGHIKARYDDRSDRR